MENLAPQVFGAIIGAAATVFLGIIVLIITNIWTDKRQQRQHDHELKKALSENMREKLEKAYLGFSKWNTFFGSMYISMIPYAKSEMSETDAYTHINNNSERGTGLIEEVEMLLHLYFPELKDAYDKVMKERGNVVRFFPPNSKKTENIKDFIKAQEAYEKEVISFKDKFKHMAKKL